MLSERERLRSPGCEIILESERENGGVARASTFAVCPGGRRAAHLGGAAADADVQTLQLPSTVQRTGCASVGLASSDRRMSPGYWPADPHLALLAATEIPM